MSKIIIKDSFKYKEIVNEMEKSIARIKEHFDNSNKNIENLEYNNVWEGKTKDIVISKYNDFKGNFPVIENSLKNYIRFLNDTVIKYETLESAHRKDLNINQDNLDIN